MSTVPRIDVVNTGINIANLRRASNLTVKDVQAALGFNTPQAIFKWQRGECLPTVDNLVILAELYNVSISEILVVIRDDG